MEEVKPLNLESEEKPVSQPTKAETSAQAAITTKPAGTGLADRKKLVMAVVILVLAGTASGYGLFRLKQPASPKRLTAEEGQVEKGTTVGVMDEETFSDTAEGELSAGGIDGEGSHHLIREGGESQNVYLTSSILDLDQFVGHKVKIWGETFEAQKAGWLMDVGRLEVLE